MLTSAFSLTSDDWIQVFQKEGQSKHILKFWLDGLYKDSSIWQNHISEFFIEDVKKKFTFKKNIISKYFESADGTTKFQMKLSDGLEVETVAIPFHKKFTVCLSTQVGCGMNCSFCYTGTQGLKRNLSAGEIVGQYLVAYEWLTTKYPSTLKPNIVFMGQGEPLHNADEVIQAIKVLNDKNILDVGHRQMTLSTVGYGPGLSRLKEFAKINIALSLHSPFQEERVKLIPVALKYPLDSVMQSLDQVPLLKRQFITFEYLLIKDFNMTESHAEAIYELLKDRKALINLIPFNPFPGSEWLRPDDEQIEDFKNMLIDKKLRVMIRKTKGSDILAACGQLKINELARNYVKA